MSSDAEQILKDADIRVEDTFAKLNMNSFLRGKHSLTKADYKTLDKAMQYYIERGKSGSITGGSALLSILKSLYDHGIQTLQDLRRVLKVSTDEAAFSILLKAFYADGGFNLIVRAGYTYMRILPMHGATEWLDNYRLTSLLDVLNIVMYAPYDHDEVFTIAQSPPPINQDAKLSDPIRVVVHMVGALRAFMMVNRLLDIRDDNLAEQTYASITDVSMNDVVAMFEQHSHSSELNDKALRLCDACAMVFPIYSGGAHGCDIFDLRNRSLSIPEIKMFCARYPNRQVSYIPNTQTYASRHGEHWVALVFRCTTEGVYQVRLICSQGSDFSCFKDGGKIVQAISGMDAQYNRKVIQHDGCNCGLFSTLAVLALAAYDNDIDRAIAFIGDRANNIVNGKDINTFREKLTGVKT